MAIQTQSFQSTQPIQSVQTIAIDARYLRAKRLLDILFTLLILLPLGLVIALVAIFIRIDSAGPIFFRQQRVGRNGVPFVMLKFRSMHVNCDDATHRAAIARYLNGQQVQSSGAAALSYKQTNDPRITRVGRFIRKTSIDELPQFFNVLRGEMTLVGPRPPLPFEVEHYSSHDMLRLSGTPGLTGTWQVYGRSRVPFHSMVEMDIEYLQHPSLRKDLKLIALTVPVMIQGRGGA
jgi:lipopolysaccharide/colanic/teichoic acid biosynthesis glycosyltransferase